MADPKDPSPDLREHRRSCHDCNQYTDRLLRFESRLERALRVDMPVRADVLPPADTAAPVDVPVPVDAAEPAHAGAAAGVGVPAVGAGAPVDAGAPLRDNVVPLHAKWLRSAGRPSPYRKGWLAVAASVLLAFVVAGALWLAVPGPSLAADVVTHMAEEPEAWRRTDVAVPDPALNDVLRDAHLRLAAGTGSGAGIVSYANSCRFRGHQVPHLVIQTEYGPVTVMVLVHEPISKSVQFDEQGYRGVIMPAAGHGSLAVLTRGPTTDFAAVERIASRVLDSIVWTT